MLILPVYGLTGGGYELTPMEGPAGGGDVSGDNITLQNLRGQAVTGVSSAGSTVLQIGGLHAIPPLAVVPTPVVVTTPEVVAEATPEVIVVVATPEAIAVTPEVTAAPEVPPQVTPEVVIEATPEAVATPEVVATAEVFPQITPEVVVVEATPEVKSIWFDNRLYQRELVAKGQKQTISSKPSLKIEVSIDEPYTLSSKIEDYSVVLDAGTPASKTFTLATQNMTQKVYATGTSPEEGKLKSFNLEVSSADEISEGGHLFSFTAKSSGSLGIVSSVTELATVEVMAGALRLIGTPLTYPSPYSITRHKTVTIQYELSGNANIEIYLIDAGGRRIKKFIFNSGAEGGSAGINKVTWDGKTDQGYLAGNAIYVGTILSRDEGKLLGKFKLTVVD